MQHRCGKAGEKPRVKTDSGIRGGTKANGSTLSGVHCGVLATRAISRNAVSTRGSVTSGMLVSFSGTPAASSGTPGRVQRHSGRNQRRRGMSSSSTSVTAMKRLRWLSSLLRRRKKEVRGDISPEASAPSLLLFLCCFFLSLVDYVHDNMFKINNDRVSFIDNYKEYIYPLERRGDL
ncbi:hypothetical protein D1007_24865 [Hordeum vulgare]|nr:hypothetical protein D1007_24865 [Hordeum vulgare]